MDSLANLINQKREELNPILGEDVKLEKERRYSWPMCLPLGQKLNRSNGTSWLDVSLTKYGFNQSNSYRLGIRIHFDS